LVDIKGVERETRSKGREGGDAGKELVFRNQDWGKGVSEDHYQYPCLQGNCELVVKGSEKPYKRG